jgi:hypothetical protein
MGDFDDLGDLGPVTFIARLLVKILRPYNEFSCFCATPIFFLVETSLHGNPM